MRFTSTLYPLLTALFAVPVFSQEQRPMADQNLGPAMPPNQDSPSASAPSDGNTVILSDVLGNDRSINIFAGFTRDFATISQRFEDSSLNTTILAPVNSAIMRLPRKPWEDPEDYDRLGPNAYEGVPGEERAQKNLRRFVEAHVVPASPWKEGEKLKTLAGGEVWWESKDGIKVVRIISILSTCQRLIGFFLQVQPGNIEVGSVASKVYNGEVWILKSVRNYA
jgi:hypothetical protein